MKKILCLILLGFSLIAKAETSLTGAKLYEMGQAVERTDVKHVNVADLMNLTMFSTYINGVSDLLEGSAFCLGSIASTSTQGRAIVMKYLRDHPEQWNESAAKLIKYAFSDSFPCNK